MFFLDYIMGYAIEHLVPVMGSCCWKHVMLVCRRHMEFIAAGCACRFHGTIVNKGSLLLLEVFST